jgi:hypothetical protein
MISKFYEKWDLTKVMVEVVTNNATEKFPSFACALMVHPTLDIYSNTKDFTWAMYGGENTLRFESWSVNNSLSY